MLSLCTRSTHTVRNVKCTAYHTQYLTFWYSSTVLTREWMRPGLQITWPPSQPAETFNKAWLNKWHTKSFLKTLKHTWIILNIYLVQFYLLLTLLPPIHTHTPFFRKNWVNMYLLQKENIFHLFFTFLAISWTLKRVYLPFVFLKLCCCQKWVTFLILATCHSLSNKIKEWHHAYHMVGARGHAFLNAMLQVTLIF